MILYASAQERWIHKNSINYYHCSNLSIYSFINYLGSKLISRGSSRYKVLFGTVIAKLILSYCLELQLGEGCELWELWLTLARSLRSGRYFFLLQEGLTKKLLSHSSKMHDSSLANTSRLWYLCVCYSLF